jgi:anti-sigma factor RsiW
VIGQRQAASIIYKRREHIINLYVMDGKANEHGRQMRGYNVVAWTKGGLGYWAVSDLNMRELQQFATLLQQ